MLRDRLFESRVRCGRCPFETALRSGLTGKIACGDCLRSLGRKVADRRENHPVRGVRAGREGADCIAVVAHQRRFAAQDVVSQLRTVEQHVLERVVNQVGGRILVGVYLVDDHLLFAFQFPVGEGRAEGDVGDQLRGFRKIAFQRRGVDRRIFLGRECVELPAEVFQPAVHLPRFPALCALEEGMLCEMRQPVLVGVFVAASGVDHQRAVRYGVAHLAVDTADAVGKSIGLEFHSIKN